MRQDAILNYGNESKWPKDVKSDIAQQQRQEKAKPVEEVNLTGLNPDHQRMLDIERGNTDVPVDLVGEKDLKGEDPFTKKMYDTLQRSIATIDRKNNRIVVNPKNLSEWLDQIPMNQRQQALRSLIGEERIHLATDDSAAGTYWKTLTGIEQAIVKRRYGNVSGMNDILWGHEALRFRMQQLSRMTPREIAEAAGTEKWTVKGLTVLETAIRGIRSALGTKASAESKAILDRIQTNLDLAKQVSGGATPGAIDKNVQDRAEKEAQELEKHARMYIESGDTESGNELLARAQELRSKTSEQNFPAAFPKQDYSPEDLKRYNELKERQKALLGSGRTLFDDPQMWKDFEALRNKYGGMPPKQLDQEHFPAARPKKRQESIFQDKFILPGMETQKPAGEQMAVPVPGTEAPPVPPEQRVSAEASGALPRLSGREIEARGTTWVRDSIQNALRATQEGKHPAPPKFKDFVDHMKRQEPKLQPGNLYEMWQKSVAGFLDTSSGSELSDLSKSIFGRESMFGRSKITDKPAPGFKLEDIPDRTAAEKYQDERRAARTQQFREKTIGALYKKLVQPQLREEALSAGRKTVTPSEVRYGGGDKSNAYQDIDAKAQTDPHLGDMLVDESRRSKDDPASLTKRLTVLQDKRTGAIEMVSTYKHPSQGVVMRDPLSPRGESSPLSSILNRYRVINSVLLDEPVKSFRQSYSSLGDYNERFGNEARQNYTQETSYDPQHVPISEFMEATEGRVEGGEGGMFQGPHRELVEEFSGGEFERGETTPLTDAEASAIGDHILAEGDPKTPGDVEESLKTLAESGSRQAVSGIAKLGRAMGEEYPFATGDELMGHLASRIFEAHKSSNNIEDFQKKLGAAIPEKEAEAPKSQGRMITTMRSRAPTSTSQEMPPGEFPMAAPKDYYREQAKKTDDDLYALIGNHQADIEDAFPQVAELAKKYEKDIPSSEVEKVYHKLDEEFTLGSSNIKLTPNGQKLFNEAAAIHSENDRLYDDLKKLDPDLLRQYWPRMARDVNSIFQRIARGVKRGVTEGTLLSRSAWFTKRRVIKALVDDQGNRQVAVITPEGKMIAYNKGKPTDLGEFAYSDVAKRQDLMDKELKPIHDELSELFKERSILTKTSAREATATRRIKNIDKRMGDLWTDAQNVEANYPPAALDDKVWVDKSGKQWKLADATTGEIESNMDVRFYHEPFSILMAENLKLKNMLRAAQWLEDFKKSPGFQKIARPADDRNLPPDWKRTEVPQLRGYVFEPHLADVLDQFHERAKAKDPNAFTAMNRVLQNAVFYDNPFLHSPNLLGWWGLTRGAMAWVNPLAYPRMVRSFSMALNDVVNKTTDYSNYLRSGTPLQYMGMRKFSDNVMKLLHDQLDQDKSLQKKVANLVGYANPLHLWSAVSHAATAGLHDVLAVQLIHEMQLRDPKLKPADAMRKVFKTFPDHRIPARVLDSRVLSKIVSSPNAIWFGAYHFSEGKAFINIAKGLASGKEMSRSEALDKIGALALMAYVAYPILNEILQKVTGRKDLSFRPAGPMTWPSAVSDVVTGKRTIPQVTPSFLTPAAATAGVISLLYNINLGNRGTPIYNPKEGPVKAAENVGKFMGTQFNQGQVYKDISSGKYDWDQIFENLMGVRKDYSKEPQNQIYGWAYDWAKKTNKEKLLRQFNQRAMETYPPSKYGPLKSFLASGKDDKARSEIQKLMQSGTTAAQLERELRPTTHPLSGLKEYETQFVDSLTPQQRAVYDEEMSNREKIYRDYLRLSGR